MLLARGRSLREVTVGTFCLFHLCIFGFCFAASIMGCSLLVYFYCSVVVVVVVGFLYGHNHLHLAPHCTETLHYKCWQMASL